MDCATGHELFITEWTFATTAKTPISSLKPFITHFKQLEKKLKQISRISVTEPTLCSYEMLCVRRNKLTISEINVWQALLLNCSIIIGQNIDGNDRNLSSQIDIFETDKALLVRLAVQLLDGLRFLHERNLGHFDLDLMSIWITGKRNFRLSDYFLRSLLLDRCRIIKECVEIVGENVSSGPSINKLPHNDLASLGNIFSKFRGLSAISAVKKRQLRLFSDDLFQSLIDDEKEGFQQIAHSRLRNEFIFIEMLGKGGFGDVMLAK
ncbi:unnamed protein product [Wuchereria bancrofti]|uniref:Protein kinase domain-containing protein n=1 Tax=Wuchereria bancrofti TaxID=6293 RepID=A0A3P7DYS9_WUCBA|nr:unnamed protein product [Wuchereria bancrofti]